MLEVFRKPSLIIRPFESKDVDILRKWREYYEWPRGLHSVVSVIDDNPEDLFTGAKVQCENIILVAESATFEPIGITHLSTYGFASATAQYSVAIPNPDNRSFGRSRDLLLLSIGSAFYVYGFSRIVSLVDKHNQKLIRMCLKGGFYVETETQGIHNRQVLTTTSKRWMPIWGAELAQKGEHVPWFKQNAAWADIRQANAACIHKESYSCASKRFARVHAAVVPPNEINLDLLSKLPPQKVLG